jgi:uncharacterized protein
MPLFAVINEQGTAWNPARSMREQEQWGEHAAYVNALIREGFVVLAGPVGDGAVHRALLIIRAASEGAIRERFEQDPWIQSKILRTAKIDPWKILASDDRLDAVLAEITKTQFPE